MAGRKTVASLRGGRSRVDQERQVHDPSQEQLEDCDVTEKMHAHKQVVQILEDGSVFGRRG